MNETFCGHCNRVFKDGRSQCDCGRETAQMTDAHRKPNVAFISGVAAATFWSHKRPTSKDSPINKALRDIGFHDGEG